MIINWFGQSCFKIQGENSVLVTDPLDKSCGLKIPRLTADVVTISHGSDAKEIKGTDKNQPFYITNPGEYEVKNIFIYGILSIDEKTENTKNKKPDQNIMYRIEMDNITIAHLGNINHVLSNGQIEKLEGTDILLIPVGGSYTINAKQATEIISQLEPRIVVPMNYNLPGLKLKNKIDGINAFCKEFGACPREESDKLKITKKDLPQEDLRVVIIKP